MEICQANGMLLADRVRVGPGESWFSSQIELPSPLAGCSFECVLEIADGTVTGGVYRRGGNRARHARVSEVVTTASVVAIGSDHLPVLSVPDDDLIDLADVRGTEIVCNTGNCNTNFVELEIRVTTGVLLVSVIAAAKQG